MTEVESLLRALAQPGIARPAALRAQLGISPQTLNRLVASAGERIYRLGRGRATQYARTRTVEGLGLVLPAFTVDEAGKILPGGKLHLLGSGRTFWEREGGALFEGLPPPLADMSPQGYLGRSFSSRYPELGLPPRIQDWSDDHRLIALARRGEDCVGNLVLGDESLQRLMLMERGEVKPEHYPRLAMRSAADLVGSSAGGERPKFAVFSGGRHVLVKFASGEDTRASHRWRDLLWCEGKALETVAAAGRPASSARCLDTDGWRFLEVERFDRVGSRGRRAVLSLDAVSNEYLGEYRSWTLAAERLTVDPLCLPEDDARSLRWLDVFGQLIGNTDRHFGNVSFWISPTGTLRLAPAYDMLPMILAPADELIAERVFEPRPPTGNTLDIWEDAALWAERFWDQVQDAANLHGSVRTFAGTAAKEIASLRRRLSPVQASTVA